jgi:hypothetical protein
MNLRSASIALDCVNNLLHYFGVVARMYAGHFDSSMGMWLHSHCFISIVSHDVFKGLLLIQHLSIFIVTLKPQSGSLVIEVISDTQVVGPVLMHVIFRLLHHNIFTGSEDVSTCTLILLCNLVYVHCFFFLLIVVNYIIDVVDINSLISFGIRS